MSFMKKHSFFIVDFESTVKLSPSQRRQINDFLYLAGEVVDYLFKRKIIPIKKINRVELSILLCGEFKIRNLNRNFRKIDKVTDVLSFPAHENLRKIALKEKNIFLGDLAICHGKTQKQARKYGITYMDEFIHLLFHGLIHLLGYDHEISNDEAELMQKWEDIAITEFSKKRWAHKIGPTQIS